ncbi:hypothetical protein ACFE04_008465 [Oxalis oulophora]
MEKSSRILTRKYLNHTSALSIDVMQKILYLLPITDQLSAGLVSTSWKSAWDFLLILDFDENIFEQRVGESEYDVFRNFVDNCIQRTHWQRVNLKSFRLRMLHYDHTDYAMVNRWINMLPTNSLEVLELSFPITERYTILDSCLALRSSVLNSLTLKGCFLVGCPLGNTIEFGNLKALSLNNVSILESMLQKIISCCPAIIDLELVECWGFKKLRLCSLPNLASVTLTNNFPFGDGRVEINSSTLQSYYYYDTELTDTDTLTCINLVDLTLKANVVSADDKQIQFLISKFPLLTTLVLDFKIGLCIIRISSSRLKTLKIRQKVGPGEIHIQAPNLEALEISLSLQGQRYDPITSLSIDAVRLQKIELNIETSDCLLCNAHFLQLRDILMLFALKIILNLKIETLWVRWHPQIIPDTCALLPVVIEHLNLNISSEMLGTYGELLEELFWICHPKSLSLRLSKDLTTHDVFLQVLKLVETADNPILSCCKSSQTKCWRHCLKSYRITSENFPTFSYSYIEAGINKFCQYRILILKPELFITSCSNNQTSDSSGCYESGQMPDSSYRILIDLIAWE